MAALSKDEQAQLEALQAKLKAAESGDSDYEVYVRDEKGRETRLTGGLATKWLSKLGLTDDPEEPETEPETEDAKDEPDEKPKAEHRWFR